MNRSARSIRTRLPFSLSLLIGRALMTLSLYETFTESAWGEPASARTWTLRRTTSSRSAAR